jgi:hypothetical protein
VALAPSDEEALAYSSSSATDVHFAASARYMTQAQLLPGLQCQADMPQNTYFALISANQSMTYDTDVPPLLRFRCGDNACVSYVSHQAYAQLAVNIM